MQIAINAQVVQIETVKIVKQRHSITIQDA